MFFKDVVSFVCSHWHQIIRYYITLMPYKKLHRFVIGMFSWTCSVSALFFEQVYGVRFTQRSSGVIIPQTGIADVLYVAMI